MFEVWNYHVVFVVMSLCLVPENEEYVACKSKRMDQNFWRYVLCKLDWKDCAGGISLSKVLCYHIFLILPFFLTTQRECWTEQHYLLILGTFYSLKVDASELNIYSRPKVVALPTICQDLGTFIITNSQQNGQTYQIAKPPSGQRENHPQKSIQDLKISLNPMITKEISGFSWGFWDFLWDGVFKF